MLTIDGSIGEGGGQVLRSALALSLVVGEPFRMVNIRARRSRPGLRPQHLAAVRAAAEVSNAQVIGAALDARELTFVPGPVLPGEYRFKIGTAGSATLVVQTILPALITVNGVSNLYLEGGTHNPQAPTFDFLAEAYRPLIERMGPRVDMELLRAGFYPPGGGRVRVRVEPVSKLRPLQLEVRGPVQSLTATVLLSKLPDHIGEREIAVLKAGLPLTSESIDLRSIENSLSPGNVVSVFCRCGQITEVFTGIGRRGVPAEKVAGEVVRATRQYLEADVPVGKHLADQLLLPLALAGGGSFVSFPPSSHTLTNIRVIEEFLPVSIRCTRLSDSKRSRVEVIQASPGAR
jgi:RNA 3'-terminal phosphate cyclase (ATP)